MRPLILVSNDDGIEAKGISFLVDVAKSFGEVVVVSPETHQSGMSHAITLDKPLYVEEKKIFGDDVEAYRCLGTPVDCVKVAKHLILEGRTIDLVLSGVNHGSNSSVNVMYSGTAAAAREGCMAGISSVAFSICDHDKDANFEYIRSYVEKVIGIVLERGLDKGVMLNVNFPEEAIGVKGMKVCRQAMGEWIESFEEISVYGGRKGYVLEGEYSSKGDCHEGTDIWALENGYASVVPCQYDITAHGVLSKYSFINNL